MTGSELAFLAIGLILGVAAGAALIAILRSLLSPSRGVRLTVVPDAVPRRRAATLANDAFTESPTAAQPAYRGPADRRGYAQEAPDSAPVNRTPVLPRPGTIMEPAFRLVEPSANGTRAVPSGQAQMATAQGVPVATGIDPMLAALRASAAASAQAAVPASDSAATSSLGGNGASVGAAVRPVALASPASSARTRTAKAAATATAPTTPAAPNDAAGGPCGDARRLADERCELATRARAQAGEAEEVHRAARRAYDANAAGMTAAAATLDARSVREAKDFAQARFRAGRTGARTTEDVEAAAREWLHDINRINAGTADATGTLQQARADAPEVAAELERTALALDHARIGAEAAEAACLAAREALADCEERAAGRTPSAVPTGPGPEPDRTDTTSDTLIAALRAGASPRIVRLLRGDRGALQEAVTILAGDDAAERRRWQIALSDLVDAILADAIARSALEFPADHAFWGPFSQAQARDIAAALSSLGYRFDGLGGWVDDRHPSQRDLSLALGYAGLDPMRMRHWPNDADTADLFSEVQVAGTEHLASTAGDLTLGELVTMLGRRADGLAEIWNAWGRVRPVLLDGS